MRRLVALVGLLAVLSACTAPPPRSQARRSGRGLRVSTEQVIRPVVAVTPTPLPEGPLVHWSGPVEHLFFHTLVVHPELAFTTDRLAQGFRDYFVTAGEFRAILNQLYDNGWSMVDIHRAVSATVAVPPGRKPFVLSEDDVNYYDYSRGRGIAWRMALDPDGNVKVEVHDAQGTRLSDDDLVPIVDEFVASHPLFSVDGAKGILALTGYEGLFGERINDLAAPDYPDRVARASAIAARLKATGWIFASHSYGHIDLTKRSTAQAQVDTQKWLAEATPIIGPTDVYVYPFGAFPGPGSPTVSMLRDAGFAIQCNIDAVPRLVQKDGVSIMARRHIDGIAFRQQAKNLAPFFDVATVQDALARRPPAPGAAAPPPAGPALVP